MTANEKMQQIVKAVRRETNDYSWTVELVSQQGDVRLYQIVDWMKGRIHSSHRIRTNGEVVA